MKLAIILGTRPEIIKMAPVIRAADNHPNIETEIWHTGQHYSFEMDRQIFNDLELPIPTYNIEAGSGSHAVQTGKIMARLEKLMIDHKPDTVLVQGDTNTVLGASLVAAKLHIPVGHVEAGLRSYDRAMPEEINRIATDHIVDVLYAPTATSRAILRSEGIDQSNILVTGNTVVDAALQGLGLARQKSDILQTLSGRPLVLITLHRAENVDTRAKLTGVVEALKQLSRTYPDLEFVWPLHPRAGKQLEMFGLYSELHSLPRLTLLEPAGYLDTLLLQANARVIMTDSGGIQEEACVLGRPCITLRENTERPESVDVGANQLTGISPERILAAFEKILSDDTARLWRNPFGDGKAGERIAADVMRRFGEAKMAGTDLHPAGAAR